MTRLRHRPVVLGIETSCDDTSVAVLADRTVLSNIVSSQITGRQFGGIVPELAARAHQANILPVVVAALGQAEMEKQDVELIAVTSGPGLVGSLLVGVNFAKGLALASGCPLVGVHHMEAHVLSVFLEKPAWQFPYVCLVVSGGHTLLVLAESLGRYRVLGETQDDAAGECFDKVGRVLGLEPPSGTLMAGPEVDRRAASGDAGAFDFPRPMMRTDDLDFSFSGLKTAVINLIARQPDLLQSEQGVNDLCASFQEAIVDVLTVKAFRACGASRVQRLVVAGGVAANARLRSRFHTQAASDGIEFHVPSAKYCTDNAAMIALAGAMHYDEDGAAMTNVEPRASWPLNM